MDADSMPTGTRHHAGTTSPSGVLRDRRSSRVPSACKRSACHRRPPQSASAERRKIHPGSVRLLSVNQEQRDHPVRVSLTDLALNVDVAELGVGSLGLDGPFVRAEPRSRRPVCTLPHPDRFASAFVDLFFLTSRLYRPHYAETLIALVSAVHTERHSNRRRQAPSRDRHILVGDPVINGVSATLGQFVGDERRLFVFFFRGRVRGCALTR